MHVFGFEESKTAAYCGVVQSVRGWVHWGTERGICAQGTGALTGRIENLIMGPVH